MVFAHKGGKCRPAETEAHAQVLRRMPLILGVHASLVGVQHRVRSGLGNITLGRQAQQEIGERIAAERGGMEREGAEIIRSAKTLKTGITHSPKINPALL